MFGYPLLLRAKKSQALCQYIARVGTANVLLPAWGAKNLLHEHGRYRHAMLWLAVLFTESLSIKISQRAALKSRSPAEQA